MLPSDETTRERYLELAQAGIDPDEVMEEQKQACQYEQLHKQRVPTTVDCAFDSVEPWDAVELLITPTVHTNTIQYDVFFQHVDWAEQEMNWCGDLSAEIAERTDTLLNSPQYFETEIDEIASNDVEDFISEVDDTPTGLRLRNIDFDAIIPAVAWLTNQGPQQLVIHVRPDDTFENYLFSWQYLRWCTQHGAFVAL